MREILFRGKSVNDGEWVEGSLVITTIEPADEPPVKHYHIEDMTIGVFPNGFQSGLSETVAPETVGQYTGLTDKNGVKIFEGDIVTAQDDIFSSPFCNGITGKIIYDEAAFFIMPKDPMETQWLFNECAVYEVIGNIHDNPELIGRNDNA